MRFHHKSLMDECFSHYDRFLFKVCVGTAFFYEKKKSQKHGSEFDLFADFVFHLHVGEPFEIQLSCNGHGIFDMLPVFALDAFDAVYIGIIGVVQVFARGIEPVIDFFG